MPDCRRLIGLGNLKMKYRAIAAIAALSVALSCCASIVRGSSQTIAITTPSATKAACTLTNPRGTWRVTSPGRVRVKRSKDDIDVTCTKPGFADATGTIPSDFNAWTIGNLLLPLGIIIGLPVDFSTGAINQYDSVFMVPMEPTAGYAPPYPPARAPNTVAPPSGYR